jgi:hypothetical protein
MTEVRRNVSILIDFTLSLTVTVLMIEEVRKLARRERTSCPTSLLVVLTGSVTP